MTFNLFDIVELLRDSVEADTVELVRASTESPLPKAGAKGTVVEVMEPDGLLVEFFDEASPADTIAVLSLHDRDVKWIRGQVLQHRHEARA